MEFIHCGINFRSAFCFRFRELYRLTPELAMDFIDEMISEGYEDVSPIPIHTQVRYTWIL